MDIIIWYYFWGILPLFVIIYLLLTIVIKPLKNLFFKLKEKINS